MSARRPSQASERTRTFGFSSSNVVAVSSDEPADADTLSSLCARRRFYFAPARFRNLANEIKLKQHLPTPENLSHNNLLIKKYDENLKQVVSLFQTLGENVTGLLAKQSA